MNTPPVPPEMRKRKRTLTDEQWHRYMQTTARATGGRRELAPGRPVTASMQPGMRTRVRSDARRFAGDGPPEA